MLRPSFVAEQVMDHGVVNHKFGMGKKLARGVFNRRVHPINHNDALPDDGACLETQTLRIEPPLHSSKPGISSVGLSSWGMRRKVHFVGRTQESLICIPAPPDSVMKVEAETLPPTTRTLKRVPKPTEKAKVRKPTEKAKVRKRMRLNDSPKCITNGTVERWSRKRYNWSELKLLDIMKEKGAVLGNPILRHALRSEARKHIGDTGLLDHLLKHMVGKVYKDRGERFCRRHNSDGAMEFWLERDDLAELRKLSGVSDPYWVPPPGWKPGSTPHQDSSLLEQKRLNEELNKLKRHMKQLLLEGEHEEERNCQSLLKPSSQVASGTANSLEKKKASHCDSIMMFRWTRERYETAELKLLEIMREKKAFLGNPILRGDLRTEARHHVGDTGLLDHLLKHMVGKVFGDQGERLCRHRNAVGAMEYWLENADMIDIRRQAGVKDPYWVPPPGWEPGDNPYNFVESFRTINQLKSEIADVRRALFFVLKKKNGSNEGVGVEEMIMDLNLEHDLSSSLEIGGNQQSYTAKKDRWPKKRYGAAELKIFDIMREKGASVTNPILQSSLRLEAGKCILDMVVVDYLLESMAGKVYEERTERFCCGYNVKGSVMCWLESTNEVCCTEEPSMGQCDVDSMVIHNDNPSEISNTPGQINQLKEEMHDLSMQLEMLLMNKYSGKQDHMAKCFRSDSYLTAFQANMALESNNNSFCVWSKQSYKAAELKLLEVMKERRAVLGNAILQPILRFEALKHIGDAVLLDHLLEHMVGKVYEETGERLCQKKNPDGTVEYWLESACLVALRSMSPTTNGELQKVEGERGDMKRHINRQHLKEPNNKMGRNIFSLSSGSGISKSTFELLSEFESGDNEWDQFEEIRGLLKFS